MEDNSYSNIMYTKDFKTIFADRLKKARTTPQEGKRKVMSQAQLGSKIKEFLDASPDKSEGLRVQVSKWEKGEICPNLDHCVAICASLNTDLDYLVGAIAEPRVKDIDDFINSIGLTQKSIEELKRDKQYFGGHLSEALNSLLSNSDGIELIKSICRYKESKEQN